MNWYLTIPDGRLSSPNLKDIAGPEDARLIFISHTFVSIKFTRIAFTGKCMEIRNIN